MTEKRGFPDGFVWGAATAAHQTEGGNTNSDWWALEHSGRGVTAEPSGDACDSYHRYGEDIALLKGTGLGTYRFSIEWARIEPAEGEFSNAQIDHYRRMVDTCLDAGVRPMVTLHHFTSPQWFTAAGGWRRADAADRFARFVEASLPIVASDVDYVCTINEPNIMVLLSALNAPAQLQAATLGEPDEELAHAMVAAHGRAMEIVRAGTGAQVGWTVATQDFQPEPGAEDFAERYAYLRENMFLDAAKGDDFVGVQAYTRTKLTNDGPVPIAPDAERTLTGWEYYPRAAADGVRNAWRRAGGIPVMVTENGIATADDSRRIDYTRDALGHLLDTIDDGINLTGYLHWSWLDNFEWASGYDPTFGLVSVDRSTFVRTVKPSAYWLGDVARANAL